jgi:WD40 repeat protein
MCIYFKGSSQNTLENLKLVLPIGHTQAIKNIISSSNGKLLYTNSEDNTVRLYDILTGKELKNLSEPFNSVNSISYNPQKEMIAIVNGTYWSKDDDIFLRIYDSPTDVDPVIFSGHKSYISSVNFSSDGKYILTSSNDKTSRIVECSNGKEIKRFVGHEAEVNSALFSLDEKSVLTAADDSTARIWDVKTGTIKSVFKRQNKVKYAEFSPDGKLALLNEVDTVKVLDINSGKDVYKFPQIPNYDTTKVEIVGNDTIIYISENKFASIQSCNFSRNGKYVAVNAGTTGIWDIENGKLKYTFVGEHGVFSPNDTIFAIAIKNIVILWNLKTGKKVKEVTNSSNIISKITFSADGKHILIDYLQDLPSFYSIHEGLFIKSKGFSNIFVDAWFKENPPSSFTSVNNQYVSCTGDNKISFRNGENGKPIFEIIQLKYNNLFVKLANSPYYTCSKDASKMLHYVTPSLKVIGFEQLDPVYNRPDIVMDSIGKYFGGADQELIANYRQLWEKRIDRLGLDKEKLGKGEIVVPSAEIVGVDNIAFENKKGSLEIKVTANDPKYSLKRFNIYVNEVPLYGSSGVSIAHLKTQAWDTAISVPLSAGDNKIQVSVMNELGLENFKYPTYVNYTPTQDLTAKTYYIGIGVNEFKESEHNLKYCVKDVTDLANSFGGPNTEVKLFTNTQVTKENILALKDYLSKTSVNDKVIISCSSHGLLDDSLNFYLAMHDVDFDNPKGRGLKYEELESLLDGIPARQKLLLLDACNSGENDKTELLKKNLFQAEKQKETTELAEYKNKTKGVIIQLEEENKKNFKKINELFVNVRNNTGSVIISAAGGQESALEAIMVDGKSIENGAFTYCILECLKQNQGKELKVNTLKQYAEKRVEEITNGKQKPTSRQETMEINWQINN